MGDGAALDRDSDGASAGYCGSLAYGVRDGQRLPHANAYLSLAVANHHQRVEAKPATAFHDLGDPAGMHHPLVESAAVVLALSLFPVAATSAASAATLTAAPITALTSAGCWGYHQNLSPPSRAASASAFTRPWN